MTKLIQGLLVVALTLVGAACAQSGVKKEVDHDVAEQPVRPMDGGVAYKGFESINQSTLSEVQKEKFRDLHTRMMMQTTQNREQTSKLKGVLFETLAQPNFDENKVNEIKKRLVKLNKQRMDLMFNALDEVKEIVGYLPPGERTEFFRTIIHDSAQDRFHH